MKGLGRPVRRVSVTLVDQTASSASNLGLGVAGAHLLSRSSYGLFAVVFTVYGLTLGASRGLVAEPLVIRGRQLVSDRRLPAEGGAIVLGIAVGTVSVAVGALCSRQLAVPLLVLAIGLPLLLAQDTLRYRFISDGRPMGALAIDLAWVGFLFVGLVPMFLKGSASLVAVLAAWEVSGAIAAVLGLFSLRLWPRVRDGFRWVVAQADMGLRFAGEFLIVAGAPQIVLFGLASIGGYAEAGAYRGAAVLLGPAALTGVGLATAVQPEMVKIRSRPWALRAVAATAAGGLVLVSLAWTVVLVFLPDSIGTLALGDVWGSARPVAIPWGIAMAATTASALLVSTLHALGAARRSLRTSSVIALMMLAGGIGGAALDGARGAAIGFIGPAWLGLVLLALQLVSELGSGGAQSPAEPVVVPFPEPILALEAYR